MASLRWLTGWLGLAVLAWSLPVHAAGLVDTVARVRNSVVLVGSVKTDESPHFQHRGTGFLVGRGDLVVTTAHALADTQGGADVSVPVVQVRQAGGAWQMRTVTVVEIDAARDLALLRLREVAGAGLRLGDSSGVREGDDLAFIGFPVGGALGYAPATHRAMVSSITSAALPSPSAERLQPQAIRSLREGRIELFQLDATAFPGNSGGPLFDVQTGEVVGVMNLALIKTTREAVLSQPSGISYAIPSRYVAELLKKYL
ncbi:serine protease [Hydrogenophaga sp.]|uniref:S1 family peptidase n=1 Tax=Hydrogenophaga sp. TaxID=1904254 RepID=UPI0026189B42|nr:serine protease [Hydrogenophaga sp.]MCW5654654.1 trypsin-like peptidase domain-containing protein [Hydrogenophaga sp.]